MQCSEVRWRFVLTLQVDTVVCSAIPRQPEVLVSSGSAERHGLDGARARLVRLCGDDDE